MNIQKRANWALAILLPMSIILTQNCSSNAPVEKAIVAAPETATGTFVDAPVEGLYYTSGTQSGFTDAAGNFTYEVGQTVTFKIGKTILGTVTVGKALVTPVDLVENATGTSNDTVINILRFLQSIDSDGEPSNGISIGSTASNALAGLQINFQQSKAAFVADFVVSNIINLSRSSTTATIVSEATALSHFNLAQFAGSYSDKWGTLIYISKNSTGDFWQTKFSSSSTPQTDQIIKIDSQNKYIIIKKSASDQFYPNKFQKVIFFHSNDGSLYTCTLSTVNSTTQAAAEALVDNTTKTSPDTSGCGAFSWSKLLKKQHPFVGSWQDNFAGNYTVSQSQWATSFGTDRIIRYNAIDNYVIIQKPSSDGSNPSKFQKTLFTSVTNTSFYSCTVSPFNSVSLVAAEALADVTIKTSPTTSGCGAFTWTTMTKK